MTRGLDMTIDRFGELWCKTLHRDAMWPIHGKYVCKKCFREHAVPWASPEMDATPYQTSASAEASISSSAAQAIH